MITSLPVFQHLSPAIVDEALSLCTPLRLDFGERIMDEGTEDEAMAIVVSGSLEVHRDGMVLAEVGPGEVVGEGSLFGLRRRSASVDTLAPSELLVITRDAYVHLRNRLNPVAWRIEQIAYQSVCERLRATTRRIAELSQGAERPLPRTSLFRSLLRLSSWRLTEATATERAQWLASTPDFESHPHLDALVELSEGVSFQPGEVVFRAGENGQHAYILVSGEVEVWVKTLAGGEECIAVLSGGAPFGMTSFFTGQPRLATCVAVGEVRALRMGRNTWLDLLLAEDPAGSVLRAVSIHAVAQQLARADERLVVANQLA